MQSLKGEIVQNSVENARVEEHVKEARDLFQNLFNLMPDPVVIVDRKGKFLAVNNRVEEITGFKRDELLGRNFLTTKIVTAKGKTIMTKNLAKRMIGMRILPYEIEVLTKDGRKLPFEINARKMEYNGKLADLVIFRDLTGRKKMEEKLRQYSEHLEELVQKRTEELLESEERYSVLVDEASDGVVILQDEKIVFINKKVLEIGGYSRDELTDIPFEKVVRMVDEKYRLRVQERHERRMRGEENPATSELELITKTGERVPVETSSTLTYFKGHPAVLTIVRDISERKRMEEERLKLEKLAAIGELATMVGHDLRNPLQAIENATYYINNELLHSSISQKTREMLKVISDSVDYADKIVRDLQDFSATKEPRLKKNDVNAIVKDALSQVQTLENVQLITELGHVPKIKVDKDMMRRVFLNLAVNAIEAMEDGGTLKVSTKEIERFVEVSFKDTGSGISKENMEKIFTPFFTTKAKGMGMGLSICKRFVDAHGGIIRVEGKEGKGSTFTVKLHILRENGGENQ